MTCKRCKDKICLVMGKPCREIENLLERKTSKKGYSSRHIRRKEIPYNPQEIDFVTIQAIGNIQGRRRDTTLSDENE